MIVAGLVLVLAQSAANAEVTLLDEDRFVRLSIERVSSCSAIDPLDEIVCDCQPGDPFGIYELCSPLLPWDVPQSVERLSSASSFAPFDATRSMPSNHASQTSSVQAHLIEGNGDIEAWGVVTNLYGQPWIEGPVVTDNVVEAWSRLFVTFSTDAPTPYVLEGAWTDVYFLFGGYRALRMRLVQGETVIAEIVCNPTGTLTCENAGETLTGTLPPGTYALEVEVAGEGDPGFPPGTGEQIARGTYAVRLELGGASALPGLGWLGRALAAGAFALAGGAALRRHRAADAAVVSE